MEALQLAQMLADLNDLQAAQDQSAARDLVSANKNIDSQEKPNPQKFLQRSATEGRVSSSPALGRMTDKYGRRIFSPPLSRTTSGTPLSTPGTPRGDNASDSDVARASTLLSLYEIRAKLKEQDSSSLMKAREKVNALAAQQQQQQKHHSRQPSATDHLKSTLSHQRDRSEPPKIHYPGRT
ncbi:hypothetical protein F5Y17DRAFT_456696 [Xylariaceae sp. FL0594]|nr:hypothetical protein F5Y17DRAFT_456696 [Xylariaceae sp. FL0594]